MSFTDYALVRARSAAIIPRSASLDRSTSRTLVTRSHSLSDLAGYYRWRDKYRPQWHTVYQYTPYRWRRDWELYDDYWNDRYYDFSPLYNSYTYPKRYYHSDSLPSSYYWSPYSSYWTRYKGYWYDYDSPYKYIPTRRYWDSAFNRYLNDTYYPYRHAPYLIRFIRFIHLAIGQIRELTNSEADVSLGPLDPLNPAILADLTNSEVDEADQVDQADQVWRVPKKGCIVVHPNGCALDISWPWVEHVSSRPHTIPHSRDLLDDSSVLG